MDSKIASKFLLRKVLSDFDKEKDLPNQEYLETQLQRLNQMSGIYNSQSSNLKLSSRQRARARDLEQNCRGLINGIKFGISFWLHKDQDLMATEEVKN